MAAAGPPRVLVVDDDEPFRLLLGELLTREGLEVVGSAVDGSAALRLTRRLRPDAITMDLEMPGMNGAEATRAIAGSEFAPPVVIVSGSASTRLLEEAMDAGAYARVSKLEAPSDLASTVRAAVGSRPGTSGGRDR